MVLAAYERGYAAGQARAGREHWNSPAVREPLRAERIATERRIMKERAVRQYRERGYPQGYDYRGGPVSWDSGLPEGSGCAWLRFRNRHLAYGLAGGSR